ncbi:MAG: hypothetical protein EXQ88_04390 [Alphaproteobacteria bacterium]|nr:hypothetical protein [Alphaproteobacteria bacterium]
MAAENIAITAACAAMVATGFAAIRSRRGRGIIAHAATAATAALSRRCLGDQGKPAGADTPSPDAGTTSADRNYSSTEAAIQLTNPWQYYGFARV